MTRATKQRPDGGAPERGERGVALVVTLMAMTLISALGMALLVVSMTETGIAAGYEGSAETLYAADAAAEMAVSSLTVAPDWDAVLAGLDVSPFVDGPATGPRRLADGSTLDLGAATSMLRCGKLAACSEGEISEMTAERPWGPNNPHWQPYVHGRLDQLLPASAGSSRTYVIAWVADDAAENDGDAWRDGSGADNPGRGVVVILAHAYGAGGAHRAIAVTVQRVEAAGPLRLRRIGWREIR